MFEVGAVAVVATMILVLVRAILDPVTTEYWRLTALEPRPCFSLVLGFMTGRPDFLDIAIVYALINFIGTVAVLKYFEYGDLGDRDQVCPVDD